ncbi:MAG: tRNA-uridine 2-sulfurtransferase [Actinomycetota bacterium]|jgi:tRNA-specific 2-thiouridylase|nr:tRNA-uridine 2-sulfurtransferase [Actinomycetota bacterium]
MTKPKAVVAMSGGVDSSVSAALLKEEGYDVTGIMLKLWKGDDINNNSGCCSLGAAEDARRVADTLDIPFYVFNFAERFEETVIADFDATYARGETPNPCVRCNQWIKFDALLDRARQLGADVLATGHYARVREEDGRYRLLRGIDPNKDQSYVLWMLSQEDLAHTRFPVGDIPKTETRRIATDLGLRTAAKPDSQEICFVREGNLDAYLSDRVEAANQPGRIVDTSGNVLGEHRGVARYTIGQRKGLGISLGVPVFVTGLDAGSNTVVVGDRSDLEVSTLTVGEVSFVGDVPSDPLEVDVQYRSHGDTFPATLRPGHDWIVEFAAPVEAVAPGQSAVFYSGDEVLGGGIISGTGQAGLASQAGEIAQTA